MNLLKPYLKYVHTVVHSTFLYVAIAYFSDQSWMPSLLIIPYTFFAHITFPGLQAKSEEILVWFFGLPLISAISGFVALKMYGMLDDPIVLMLVYAVFSVYLFSNIIALGVRVVPVAMNAPGTRQAFKNQPIGFLLLLFFGFVTLLAYVEAI